MGTADILLGGNPPIQGVVAILLGLLHATETGIRLCGPLPTYPLLRHSSEGGGGVNPLSFYIPFFTQKVPLLGGASAYRQL